MVEFIALAIMKTKDKDGLEAGKNKYKAYFIKKNAARLYGKYRDDVDTILELEGYSDCIVAE